MKKAYDTARAAGKYGNLYAGTTPEEYWAEGVQDYFDVHATHDGGDINSRAQLASYDPALYGIIDGVFRNAQLGPSCPAPVFSASRPYRLRNVEAGGALALDVTSLHPSGRFSGQARTIARTGGGCYRLTNAFTGSGQSLDVTDMHPTGSYSGECWRFFEVTSGVYRFANDFLGASRSLTASGTSITVADKADVPEQQWTITPF